MTARAVDNGGAGTSVAAMDAIRNSSRRGDAAARGERGSRSRRAVILRAGCSDESSETVTLASIARRTIPRQSAASRKQPVFGLPRDERNSNATRGAARARAVGTRDLPTRLSSSSYRRLSGRTAGAMPFGATERGRDERDPTRCARTNVPGAVFPPSFVPRKCREATRSWHADHANSPPARLPLTRHAPRAAPRRPAAMFATTPSAAAPAGGSPDWLDRQVARETHERVDEISKRTPVATPASADAGARRHAFPSAQRHRYARDGQEVAGEDEDDSNMFESSARNLFANLAAPPPSFAGATRARRGGAAAAGAGLAGSRFAPIGGGGLSLQDLIAGKNGAEPGRTEGRAEVFSPSPAKRGEERRAGAAGAAGAAAKKQKRRLVASDDSETDSDDAPSPLDKLAVAAEAAPEGAGAGPRAGRPGRARNSGGASPRVGRPARVGDSDSDDDGNKIGAVRAGVTKKTRGRPRSPRGERSDQRRSREVAGARRAARRGGMAWARLASRLRGCRPGRGRSERRRFRRGGREAGGDAGGGVCRRAEQFRPPTPAPERVLAGIRGGRRRRRPRLEVARVGPEPRAEDGEEDGGERVEADAGAATGARCENPGLRRARAGSRGARFPRGFRRSRVGCVG